MTILKSSKDPIVLKKVSMQIWHLKDELIAILKSRFDESKDIEKIKDISDLKEAYSFGDRWLESEEEEETEEKTEKTSDEGEKVTVFDRSISIPEDKLAHGQAILFEVNLDNIHFFSDRSFYIGSSIVLKLNVPKAFGVIAEVKDCRAFDLESKIISKIKYPYRIIAEFKFLREGQKSLMRRFLMAVDPRLSGDPEVELELPEEEISAVVEEEEKEVQEKEEEESAA